MYELGSMDFGRMLGDPQFKGNVDTILNHQDETHGDAAHHNCGGFYVKKYNSRFLCYTPLAFRHDEVAAERRFGHIPEADWGDVVLYMSARSRLMPTAQDLNDIQELHADNPNAVYGVATESPLGNKSMLFLRHSATQAFVAEQLDGWDETQKLQPALEVIAAAGLNWYVNGAANRLNVSISSSYGSAQLFK